VDNIDLNALKGMWLAHKREEDNAKAMRLEVETAILSNFPTDKTEGSVTNADFGITVAYKLTRSVDSEGIQNIWNDLSANAQKAFKVKFDIDLKQFRAIQDLDPEAFAELAPFVTSKPAKPSITIKGE
jgi:hypothetical protein